MSSVGSVGASPAQFLSIEDSSSSEVVSISGQLAVLMLESQEQRKEIAHDTLASARKDFEKALDDEVAALKSAADAARRGAIWQAGVSFVGSGTSIVGHFAESKVVSEGGAGLSALAEPLGRWIGTSHGTANAKSAEGKQQAAKWQIDDMRDTVRSAEDLQNKALDWVSSISDRDAATMATILSNKV